MELFYGCFSFCSEGLRGILNRNPPKDKLTKSGGVFVVWKVISTWNLISDSLLARYLSDVLLFVSWLFFLLFRRHFEDVLNRILAVVLVKISLF